jgi:hypothetical protein
MAWPPWPKTNENMLASYVLPQLAARLKLAQSRDDVLVRPDGPLKLLSLTPAAEAVPCLRRLSNCSRCMSSSPANPVSMAS